MNAKKILVTIIAMLGMSSVAWGQNPVGTFSTVNVDNGLLDGGRIYWKSAGSPTWLARNLAGKLDLARGEGQPVVLQLINSGGQYRVGIHKDGPAEELELIGDFKLSGSIIQSSDVKYKTNIASLSNSLEKVMQLRGVNYYFRTKEFSEQSFPEGKQIGLIAQEVEKIFPELVRTYDDGKAVDYVKLIPVVIEAIKEQHQIIESQRAKIRQIELALSKLGINLEQASATQIAEPSTFALQPNYPNPFNPTTTINYDLPSSQRVTLKVYDAHGRELATLVDRQQPAGRYTVPFDASHLSSGTYFYKLTAGSFSETKKMAFVK